MNIIIPACGAGQRFIDAGFTDPKPFIQIGKRKMVEHVLQHLPNSGRRVLLVQEGIPYRKGLALQGLDPTLDVVCVRPDLHRLGAVQTILSAAPFMPFHEPVLVVNSDNVIHPSQGWTRLHEEWLQTGKDAVVVTFLSVLGGPYSYVKLDGEDVADIVEKKKISDFACAGAFWFSSYGLLYDTAMEHISGEADVGQEYYVAPMIQRIIDRGCTVTHLPLFPSDKFVRMGAPEDIPHAKGALR